MVGGCSASYYDKTKYHFIVRILKHPRIFALAGKRVNGITVVT